MKYTFYKLQGAGNDFIFFDGLSGEKLPPDPEHLAQKLCRRRFSVGADGIIFLTPAENADAFMTIYNSDGSRAKMCGNGIRCAARYMFEKCLVNGENLIIDTDSGVRNIRIHSEKGRFISASADMGVPDFLPKNIPVCTENDSADDIPILFPDGKVMSVCCVSMGNPHAVTLVPDTLKLKIAEFGPFIENHPVFPDRTNVEFITVKNSGEIDFRVWERGCGETLACGTGICAAAAVAVKKGLCPLDSPITVHASGGELEALCSSDRHIYLTGPADLIYKGEIETDD